MAPHSQKTQHSGLMFSCIYTKDHFSLTSAAEDLQYHNEATEGVPGERNVSPGIIMLWLYYRSRNDRALDAVLSKLHSSGLTVNKQNYEFHKKQEKFVLFKP